MSRTATEAQWSMPQAPPDAPDQHPTAVQWFRFGWNLLNLSTVFGLLVALTGRAKLRRGPRGLLLAEHYRFDFPNAGAFTVGNVVTTRHTMAALEEWHPGTFDHEDVHAWQYCYALGLPYLPAYLLCCCWSWLRTGDWASRNVFERQAGLARGGYVERPATWAGWRRLTGGKTPPTP